MCPTMIDDPISPGRGLPVYQPASVVLTGTWSVPCGVRPSRSRGVRTPIAGIVRAAGRATCLVERGAGGAAGGPSGRGEGEVPRVTGRPGQPDGAADDREQAGQERGGGHRPPHQPGPGSAVPAVRAWPLGGLAAGRLGVLVPEEPRLKRAPDWRIPLP